MGALSSNKSVTAEAARILIYDDDAAYGRALQTMLTEAGFTAHAVTHFQEALTVLEASDPIDLLLADIVVPAGVNGLAMSRMARMRNRSIKVIFMTGYDVPNIEGDTFEAVLRKPMDPAELLAAINTALQR
jgi:CheY-like chemotaxis protein